MLREVEDRHKQHDADQAETINTRLRFALAAMEGAEWAEVSTTPLPSSGSVSVTLEIEITDKDDPRRQLIKSLHELTRRLLKTTSE